MSSTAIELTNGIGPHLLAFVLALLALALFVIVFIKLTPYSDIALIKEGNSAAAIVLGGCILGLSIPLSQAVAQSTSVLDLSIWSAIAMFAQISVYGIVRIFFKEISNQIQNDQQSIAIFLASLFIAIGLLNAAAMTA